jgi:FkbM family methyltransferase
VHKIFSLNLIRSCYPNLSFGSKNFIKIEKKIQFIKKNSHEKKSYSFKEFGKIFFPFVSMGKISSTDLFCANEFIIFFFYFLKKFDSKEVADFGANLGLHTIIMAKCGFNVSAFEPDPKTFIKLKKNLKLNKLKNVKLYNKAIFSNNSNLNFTRVHNNLTGSHITSEKKSYGPTSVFKVEAIAARDIVSKFDLIKIDIESAEAKVITSLKKDNFLKTDIILEIANKRNAIKIYNFLTKKKLKFYSQKNCFNPVSNFNDMPTCHNEGMLFISQSNFLKNIKLRLKRKLYTKKFQKH